MFWYSKFIVESGQSWFGIATPETIFSQMEFADNVKDGSLNVAIGDIIKPLSLILYGKGSDNLDSTMKHSQFFKKKHTKIAEFF